MAKEIKSTGPVPCDYMLIAERPGRAESQIGRVLVGPSGKETDRFLFTDTKIDRNRVYCTNLVKDYRDGKNPSEEEIIRDLPLLMEEIKQVNPKYIGLMGLFACHAFLGPDIELEALHGLAYPANWCFRCQGICTEGIKSNYNNILGVLGMAPRVQRSPKLRQSPGEEKETSYLGQNQECPSSQIPLHSDDRTNIGKKRIASQVRESSVCKSESFGSIDESRTRRKTLEEDLREWSSEEWECEESRQSAKLGLYCMYEGTHFSLPAQMMPMYHPAAGLHRQEIQCKVRWDFEQFGKMIRGEPVLYYQCDTVGQKYHETKITGHVPTFAGVDTEGTVSHPWCLSYSCDDGIGKVDRNRQISSFSSVVLHGAIHDLPVLAAIGVTLDHWTDTLQMAALLGTEPLGLKALARRYCGMVMKEYTDVVMPAQRRLGLEYLGKVIEYAKANSRAEGDETPL